jgi:hypothetical protein
VGLFVIAATWANWAVAQNAPTLRYGFQTGRQYGYEVKIEADLDDTIATREGVLYYAVVSANDQQVVLKPSGRLAASEKPKPGRVRTPVGPPGFPMGPRGFPMGPPMGGFPGFGAPRPEGLTINRRGEVIQSGELNSLPFLLGDQETLMLEEFPQDPRMSWQKQKDVAVMERSSSGPFPMMRPGGPFAPGNESRSSAREVIDLWVAEVRPDAIRVGKKYSLRTAGQGAGGARFDFTGAGEFLFDPKEGVIASLGMKYELRVNDQNVTVRVPITIGYRLLSAAELAQRQKAAEEAAAKVKVETAKASAPKPFAPGERARLLKELKSKDLGRMKAAADRLCNAPVDDGAAQFAKALAPLLSHSDFWVQGAASKAMITWATVDVEPQIIEASTLENVWVRQYSIEALGKLNTETAAEAIAAQMYRNRGEVGKALRAMGPIAEAATIPLLKDRDGWVRKETVQVLGEIGGEAGLKALTAYSQKLTSFDLKEAETAIAAIEERLASAGKSPAEPKAKAAGAATAAGDRLEYRTWSDATGTYQVVAAMVSYEDKKVTLQKKEGGTLRIPVEKLSKADQDYVAKRASAKPANPFDSAEP